ncbi:Microphthalmia-associated transcription factor [Fukomys damarensis]|uniref:Microphthalmia-associated transcription factor n=1 Tax=Fukomys damarensis TaxID=885580 RepID=A0A091DZS0_FUKDA|nr:Microphthalmia-associated transcription factor [Fukomys damarensis]
MQSESGIVPDFEVGEEFHEEPKTYYELKSQPLKSSQAGPLTVPGMPTFIHLWHFCIVLASAGLILCPDSHGAYSVDQCDLTLNVPGREEHGFL